MTETVLLVGNGINNINSNNSWDKLLQNLHQNYYDPKIKFDQIKNKPFPLVYEQIVAYQLKKKKGEKIESEIKKLIAEDVQKIQTNNVHKAIMQSNCRHIITSNYEFNLLARKEEHLQNEGDIKEKVYSIFRHFKDTNGKKHWHLHGDAQNTYSINLGYEHYCGQLQRMREYVTVGYREEDGRLPPSMNRPLMKRRYLNSARIYSWLDFFFKDDIRIKIIGFKMDLEEIDLWWLITYRAKVMYGAKKGFRIPVNNSIEYYIPKQFTTKKMALTAEFEAKKDLMEKMGIKVKILDIQHSEAFYLKALKM